jgi:hypothetical protein
MFFLCVDIHFCRKSFHPYILGCWMKLVSWFSTFKSGESKNLQKLFKFIFFRIMFFFVITIIYWNLRPLFYCIFHFICSTKIWNVNQSLLVSCTSIGKGANKLLYEYHHGTLSLFLDNYNVLSFVIKKCYFYFKIKVWHKFQNEKL